MEAHNTVREENKKMKYNKRKRNITGIIAAVSFALILAAGIEPKVLDRAEASGILSKLFNIEETLTGRSYTCEFYSNDGNKFMTVSGDKVNIKGNKVKEYDISSDGDESKKYSLSSIITITVDGKQIESCGTTVLFAQKGLTPDVSFDPDSLGDIDSKADSIGDNAYIANIVNKYKNFFGKPVVAVIQSQLGNPICAYSGNKVYWENCENLPKTTKLVIDKKILYIHRANFQIIDSSLIK